LSEKTQITKSAGIIGISTLASRVLGLLRDICMTFFFGTGIVADAFYVAFMIPNLLRRLVGEGSLTIAFVSVFTKLKQDEGEEDANKFATSFWTLMILVLAGLTVLGIVFSPQIVWLFTNPEFQASPEKFELAIELTQGLFPYLFFIGLVALSMGILNSYKKFFAPAFAPVLLNMAWILSLLALKDFFKQPGHVLVFGILLGGALQLLLQLPFLMKVGISLVPNFNFKHPAIKRIGLLMLPSAFAVGIVQINTLIATYFITAFEGGRSQLYYANRLTEFPYALFTLAIATAILPVLSEQAGKGEKKEIADTLSYGMRLAAFIVIPASIGLAFVGKSFIHIIFEHGEFTSSDTALTSYMLIMDCLGMWAIAGHRLIIQAYYSLEDMVTPLWSAAVAMIINTAGCILLTKIEFLGRAGVPLSISLAATVNFIILWALLPKLLDGLKIKGVFITTIKALLCSVPFAGLVYLLGGLELWEQDGGMLMKVLILVGQVFGGTLLYAVFAKLTGMDELNSFLGIISRKLKRN
jgi:putative peptidoglycan lipid II flippase